MARPISSAVPSIGVASLPAARAARGGPAYVLRIEPGGEGLDVAQRLGRPPSFGRRCLGPDLRPDRIGKADRLGAAMAGGRGAHALDGQPRLVDRRGRQHENVGVARRHLDRRPGKPGEGDRHMAVAERFGA